MFDVGCSALRIALVGRSRGRKEGKKERKKERRRDIRFMVP